MTFTMFHTHRHTHTLMGPVTAVTFAGAGPQTGRRGPREPQAAIVLSPRKPASLCQTCFSVCFLFYVFNVGKGNVSPLIYHPPPPPHPSTLHCVAPPPTPTNHTHLPSPPTNSSTFVSPLRLLFSLMLSPPHPLCFPLEIVICKALCLDSPYLCRGVAASLSLNSFLSVLREGLAQAGTFSSSCTEKKEEEEEKMCTTLKQENLSPKQSRLSHAKPIFFIRLNKLTNNDVKENWRRGVGGVERIWLWLQSDRGCPKVIQWGKTNLKKLDCYYF